MAVFTFCRGHVWGKDRTMLGPSRVPTFFGVGHGISQHGLEGGPHD